MREGLRVLFGAVSAGLGGSESSDDSLGALRSGGVERREDGRLCAGVRSMDIVEVFGVARRPDSAASWHVIGFRAGERAGESGARAEFRLSAARDLRGETLRTLRRRMEPVESKLPWEMFWRQVMMRSFGGCVDTLSLLERLVRERMLLGRPIFDDVSQVSLRRMRLSYAQSCRKTFNEPL